MELLAQGAFDPDQAYNVAVENKANGMRYESVFRIVLPFDPHYKVESDVAVIGLVRQTIDIPVPIIHAFDSLLNNRLGFEWMLIEMVQSVQKYHTTTHEI